MFSGLRPLSGRLVSDNVSPFTSKGCVSKEKRTTAINVKRFTFDHFVKRVGCQGLYPGNISIIGSFSFNKEEDSENRQRGRGDGGDHGNRLCLSIRVSSPLKP